MGTALVIFYFLLLFFLLNKPCLSLFPSKHKLGCYLNLCPRFFAQKNSFHSLLHPKFLSLLTIITKTELFGNSSVKKALKIII